VPVTLLHTSDWHVGKSIRGTSRADEHRAVLGEVAGLAASEDVDVVVVAGDLFDTAAPTPESEEIVYRALLALSRTGASVVVIAGNHDNARSLRAVAPLLALGNVHVIAEPRRPDDGGVVSLTTRDGTPVRVAGLPFVSKRGIVRAGDLMAREAFENAQRYSERMRSLLDAMCTPFADDAVNVLAAHTFVLGAAAGGGERPAHLVDEYAVTAPSFPASIGYGALGHLHRAQRIPAGAPLHYCGSPLQLDFGEDEHAKQVNVVTIEPGAPADVRAVPLRAGRPLRTITGTLDELGDRVDDIVAGDPWLRVVVRSVGRAGLADDVRTLLGDGVVDVRIDAPTRSTASADRPDHRTRSPQELFAAYLAEQGFADERVTSLFAELLDHELVGEEVAPA
jgi:exonuclease SbcD